MNSYLDTHLGEAHRDALLQEAASARLASARVTVEPTPEAQPERGLRAAIRRLLGAPEADPAGFLPRLVDYPVAHR